MEGEDKILEFHMHLGNYLKEMNIPEGIFEYKIKIKVNKDNLLNTIYQFFNQSLIKDTSNVSTSATQESKT